MGAKDFFFWFANKMSCQDVVPATFSRVEVQEALAAASVDAQTCVDAAFDTCLTCSDDAGAPECQQCVTSLCPATLSLFACEKCVAQIAPEAFDTAFATNCFYEPASQGLSSSQLVGIILGTLLLVVGIVGLILWGVFVPKK